MEKYSEYNESGIFWQPLKPSNWNVTVLRHILTKLDRKKEPNSELLICSNHGYVFKRGDSKLGLVADSDDIYQGVKDGDLLIHGMDTWHGAIAISKLDGMCTPVVHVCDSSQNKQYVAYYLRNMATSKIFKLISNGVRQNTSDFRSWDKVGKIPIPLPTLQEQSAIVSYLDVATAKMDKFVTKKEQEIELLDKLKQRMIADAVTKGLDPNAEMVPCDIPWIKQIPKGWKKVSFGTICKEKSLIGYEKEELLSVFLDKGVVRFNDVEKKRTNTTSLDLSKYQLVEPGDFVLNNQQAWRGSVGVSSIRGIVSPAYIILSLSNLLEPDFANLMFRSYPIVAHYCICSKGVGSIQRNLYLAILKRRYLYIPSREEQKVIVSFIKSKCEKIDKLQAGLQQEIEKVKQYKQRLISDVVTGQIKVC